MNNNLFLKMNEAWTRRLKRTNLYMMAAIFCVDWIGFFISRYQNTDKMAPLKYIVLHILLPMAVNFLGLLVCTIREKKADLSEEEKNALPLFLLWLIGTTTAIAKYLFPVVSVLVCFPVLCSVFFDNRKLTNKLTILAGVSLAVSGVTRNVFLVLHGEPNSQPLLDIFMSLVLVIGSYVICHALTHIQRQKNELTAEIFSKEMLLQDELRHDGKTGLYSAAVFKNAVQTYIENDKPFFLLISDIDEFKVVNDSFGHNQGDIVLIRLAEIFKHHFGKNAYPSRFGGEEYTAVWAGKSEDEAFARADSYRMDFEGQTYTFMTRKVTISVGMAMWEPGLSDVELFDRADAALYFAKTHGKNRTCVWTPELSQLETD